MNKYKITIKEDNGPFDDKPLTGEFYGDNETEATNMALEFYSHELDTDIDAINILSINKI